MACSARVVVGESRYTANKGVLPEVLMDEMRQAFARSEEHLDQSETDGTIQQRLQAQRIIQDATPAQLGRMLEAIRAGKMGQAAS